MKKVLVIGSTCADVIVRTPKIPVSREDVNIQSQSFALGGCAYNVANAIQYSGGEYLLFSPIGTGIFGDYVKKEIEKTNIKRAPLFAEEANGSCYCIVEPNGERSFLCEHGAEYWFKKEWFDALNVSEFEWVYVCGLEIEEKQAVHILDFLEKAGLKVYFAPGPRMHSISKDKMQRLLNLKPIFHMNRDEVCYYTGKDDFETACKEFVEATGNDAIITDGERGSYYCYKDGSYEFAPGEKAKVVDTIGAGDFHIGTFLACQSKGMPIKECLKEANRISAKVVAHEGANPE